MASSKPAPERPAKCPICGRATEVKYRPFCSRRCADVDLSRWLSGSYAVPVAEDADEDGDRAPPPPEKDDPGRPH